MASATAVAALPNHHPSGLSSSNPLLWQTVFGTSGGGSPQSSQDGVVTPPDGLPRIRTRPVGEAREGGTDWRPTCGDGPRLGRQQQQQQQLANMQGANALERGPALLQGGPLAEAIEHRSSTGQQQEAPPQQQQQQQQQQQSLLKTGSLLLRSRTSLGSPGSVLAGSARVAPGRGPLFSGGSCPLSPAVSGGGTGGYSRNTSTAGAGPQMRSLEADRDAIAAGRRLVLPPGSASHLLRWEAAPASVLPVHEPPPRLCVRWLDELVVGLWVRRRRGRGREHLAGALGAAYIFAALLASHGGRPALVHEVVTAADSRIRILDTPPQHDLSAHLEWRCLDQSLKETRGEPRGRACGGQARSHVAPTAHSTPAAVRGAWFGDASSPSNVDPPLFPPAHQQA